MYHLLSHFSCMQLPSTSLIWEDRFIHQSDNPPCVGKYRIIDLADRRFTWECDIETRPAPLDDSEEEGIRASIAEAEKWTMRVCEHMEHGEYKNEPQFLKVWINGELVLNDGGIPLEAEEKYFAFAKALRESDKQEKTLAALLKDMNVYKQLASELKWKPDEKEPWNKPDDYEMSRHYLNVLQISARVSGAARNALGMDTAWAEEISKGIREALMNGFGN